MIKYKLLLLFIIIANTLKAQSINGKIIDENNEALSYINVAIYQQQDSILVSGTISDPNGKFSLKNIECGIYTLSFSSVGYQTKKINLSIKETNDINLPNIILKQSNVTLGEVIVKAKQNPLTINKGIFTLNVNKSILKEQNSLFNILSFLPGVLASEDKITIIGKGTPLILLNDKEVKSLSELEILNPKQIKEVSIDSHPSAEYSSKYSSVIRISTIDMLKDHISSQITHVSTFGRKYTNREAININISHKKWSSYFSYQFKDTQSNKESTNEYEIYNTDNNSLTGNSESYTHDWNHSKAHDIIYGTSYKFDQTNSIDLQYILGINNQNNRESTKENLSFNNNKSTNTTSQKISEKDQLHNILLMYKHKINAEDFFSLTGGYIYSTITPKNSILTNNESQNLIAGNNNYNAITFEGNFKHNIFKDYNLQFGGKYINILNNGNSSSTDIDKDISLYNNNTSLKDALAAFYFTLAHQFGKLYTNIGVRGEYLISNYKQDNYNLYKNHDIQFYPSLNMEYTFNPNILFSLGYANKSKRPSFSQLSPLIRYVNSMLYETGNPNLKIMNAHNAYLTCILYNKFVFEFNYTYKKDLPMYVFQPNPNIEGSLVNSPINVNSSYYQTSISYSDKLGIYTFAYNGTILWDMTKIPYLKGQEIPVKPLFHLDAVNQFDIFNNTKLFCYFTLASSYNTLGSKIEPTYDLTIGFLQTFFKDKRLQLVISGRDLLHHSQSNTRSYYKNVYSWQTINPDSRKFTISIKYNLNNFRNLFHKNDGNADELSRISNNYQ